MKPIYSTNPEYIKYLDCNPSVFRRVMFDTCNIDIKEGSNVISKISLCDTRIESLGSSELGGCGGSLNKKILLKKQSNYILTAPEIGQAQGEVQMIVIKVKYQKEQSVSDRYLTWEYKGNVYPINTLMVLSGRTKADVPWQGWDLSYYSNTPTSPDFSPQIFPPITSPDSSFGGILFNNPGLYDVDLEILIFN